MSRLSYLAATVLCILGLPGISAPATAAVIPPSTLVAGISQAALADQFYRWLLEAPGGSNNPLFDTTGAAAHVNNTGPVFLVAGSNGGGFVTRSFSVPENKPLFVPIVTTADIELPLSLDANSCLGKSDPTACAIAFLDTFPLTGGLEAKLDGVDLVADFTPFFQQSSTLQSFCPPSNDNIFGVPAGECGGFVQKGYYIALDALSPGEHILEFGSAEGGFGAIDVLRVPEPTSLVLFTGALVGLAAFRRKAAR